MKTGLIVAGVGVLMAAVYFIARRPTLPMLNNKQPNGKLPAQPQQNVASQLLTSQNIGALLTLFGGTAAPAPQQGKLNLVTQSDLAAAPSGGGGFVTEY